MTDVREIAHGQTELAAEALLELRPCWRDTETLVDVVDRALRSAGYRLAGVFIDQRPAAVAVAGFRECHALAWGHCLYVDDLSTLPRWRGAGHGDRLMTWLADEAARLGCEGAHLDSGVGADRAPAHRLYMRHHLRISAHHFQRDL